jgi:hypothetical protein
MKKHTVVIVVHGGIADVVDSTVPKNLQVDIVDIDNLQETTAEDFRQGSLTHAGKDYLRKEWPELARELKLQ